MGLNAPTATEMFSDATSAKDAAFKKEEFDVAFKSAVANSVTDPTSIMAIKSGASTFALASGNPMAQLELLAANKSLSPDALSGLQTALASQRLVMQDIQKDISLTSPLSTGFAAFDLEAPAKLLTPRPTPLRNKIPRKKGVGTSHRVKRLLGHTGTGTGGVGNIWPGITESTTTTFGSVSYERGAKIAYAADDLILPYNSYSLSDSVSFDANFSGMDFQDLRQLSSTSTLFATMLMEERMMLMGRGTASGYSGLLATPTVATPTLSTSTAGQTSLTNGTTYYVYATADAGAFGESAPSTVVSVLTTTATQVINISITPVAGALGYKIYVGTTTGAANAYYAGRTTAPTAILQGSASTNTLGNNLVFATTGTLLSTVVTAQGNGTQLSAYATGYDGILPTVLGSNSGKNNAINTTFSTSNPGVEYQTVFSSLYDAVKADPDEIFLNGADRRQLSDAIKNGSTANYRLNLSQDEQGNYVGGAVMGGIHNEITGKLVPITVHPWLPQGVSPVVSYVLPIPDTNVSDVWSNYMVQDMMGIQWPVSQFAYEFSTYFRGAFFCSAPAWNGAVSGIVSA